MCMVRLDKSARLGLSWMKSRLERGDFSFWGPEEFFSFRPEYQMHLRLMLQEPFSGRK
jgi:hypothetical protein